jgi:ABC-type antimicrobial peptide transport system permease subunit
MVVRTSDDPLTHAADARSAVAFVDPDQPVFDLRTMDEVLRLDLNDTVVLISIVTLFAAVALGLAALGLYGVVAYGVAQRTPEIGLRSALGASKGDLLRLVARQGITPIATGLALGLVLGVLLSRALGGMLYAVTPLDPVTYGGVVTILFAASSVACVVPAVRALRVQPGAALRQE